MAKSKANKLTPNVEKSKLLYFDLLPACKRNVFDVYIIREMLEFNSEAKYLGVTINNKLTWRQHIENMKNKIKKGIRILKKCVTFYRTIDFVKPYVDYGSLAWGGATDTHLLEVSINQLNPCTFTIKCYHSKQT